MGFVLITMVIILDGASEIVAHVRSNLFYLICYRHLMRSKSVTYQIFFLPKIPIFLHVCAIFSELPSNNSAMVSIKYFMTSDSSSKKSDDRLSEVVSITHCVRP